MVQGTVDVEIDDKKLNFMKIKVLIPLGSNIDYQIMVILNYR